jgi:hypothetical protein
VLILPEIVPLPTVGHPLIVAGLYAAGAMAGVLVGSALNQRLADLAGRLGPISRDFQPVLAVAVLTAFASALGWSLLWSLPLTGLAIIACYVTGALVIYQPKRWPLLDGMMAGLFCGFVLSLAAITVGLVDPGSI